MDIYINRKPADITLDTEKNLGDVLQGIEMWLTPSRSRIKGISIDGEVLGENELGAAFGKNVDKIKRLDIAVASYCELATEALGHLQETCVNYENSPFMDRRDIYSVWEASAAARFLASDIKDIYELARGALSGEGLSTTELVILIDERLREFANPGNEIGGSSALVDTTAGRMEELSLDIQTGKDARAAETMQLFSRTGEKLLRILSILESEGLAMDTFTIDDLPAGTFLNEFNTALNELSAAYTNKDMVLAGDIAEYELAPRLRKLFSALDSSREPFST
ncbi:MAG: hypothetical protein FWF26_02900 [Treponema sp.]|nr:hypothetical protein [Treponema sp.]